MSKRSVEDVDNRDIADATGPQRQETTNKVARLELNDTTTACAVTPTKQQQEDTTLLAGLEKHPAFCMCISVNTMARLAVLIAARPVESRCLCAGGCGHDVLVTQYRDKGEGGYYHAACKVDYEARMKM